MKLTSTIYSFKNRKPVFFDLKRFHKVKNPKQLDKLINKLLDLSIDAVLSPSPENISFPAILEMQSGFGLKLKVVDQKEIKKEIENLKKLVW